MSKFISYMQMLDANSQVKESLKVRRLFTIIAQ